LTPYWRATGIGHGEKFVIDSKPDKKIERNNKVASHVEKKSRKA